MYIIRTSTNYTVINAEGVSIYVVNFHDLGRLKHEKLGVRWKNEGKRAYVHMSYMFDGKKRLSFSIVMHVRRPKTCKFTTYVHCI